MSFVSVLGLPNHNTTGLTEVWEFAGGLVVEIQHFHCCDSGLVPGWETDPISCVAEKQKQNLFSHNSGGWNSKIKVPTVLVSDEFHLPGLQIAAFSQGPQKPFFFVCIHWYLSFFNHAVQHAGS